MSLLRKSKWRGVYYERHCQGFDCGAVRAY
jgi:hypothetical protein